MHPRFKQVAYILPPLVVAAVYFDYIHIGPVKQQFSNYFAEKKAVEETFMAPMVEKFVGEVKMKEGPGLEPILLKGGELLKKGSSVITGANSRCLLTLRGIDFWTVNLGTDTQVNIDELMRNDPTRTSVFNLIRGSVMLSMKNRSGAKRDMQVRTKFASFSVRGTTFAVLSDGEKHSVLTVREGAVEVEKFKEMEKSLVREGYTYLVNREGQSKVQIDLDTVDLFTWNDDKLEKEIPTLETVVGKIGDLGPLPDESEKKRLELLKNVDDEFAAFRTKDQELQRELEILSDNAEQSRAGLMKERKGIEKDIKCLETSLSECLLSSDKILLKEGFPRTWGTPQYRNSMVVGLYKYLQKREEEVKGREEEADELKKLMAKRANALRTLEADRRSEKELDKIIPKLQDDRLRR
ncbi:MAG: FecR domain-containing protein [Bacteriovoracaceae bacterium]